MPDAVYKQALDDVSLQIQNLDLEGVNDTSVKVQKIPWDDKHIPRGITVSWNHAAVSRKNDRATNLRDLIGYPCFVTIVEGTGRGWSDEMNRIADRSQKIFREFNNKRLTGVNATNVNHVVCKVTAGELTIPDKYRDNYDITQLTVWCWFLEPRDP